MGIDLINSLNNETIHNSVIEDFRISKPIKNVHKSLYTVIITIDFYQ